MTEPLSGDDVIVLICCTSLSLILSSYEKMFGYLISVTMNFTVDELSLFQKLNLATQFLRHRMLLMRLLMFR